MSLDEGRARSRSVDGVRAREREPRHAARPEADREHGRAADDHRHRLRADAASRSSRSTTRRAASSRRATTGVVALGSDIALKLDAEVGEHREDPRRAASRSSASPTRRSPPRTRPSMMSLADAQRLYAQDLPAAVRASVNRTTCAPASPSTPKTAWTPRSSPTTIDREVAGHQGQRPDALQGAGRRRR